MARKHKHGEDHPTGRASEGRNSEALPKQMFSTAEGGHDGPLASGAPEAGGATSRGSRFGGRGVQASLLRALARFGRGVEAAAYRRLRDLDLGAGEPAGERGRPRRVREAAIHHGRPHPA